MKTLVLLIAFASCISVTAQATDKIYKTYQDYLDGKPMAEGTIKQSEWVAFVKGYIVNIKKTDGTTEKVDVKGVWGFEQQENLNGYDKVTFLNRIQGNQIYRLLSAGKYNCWCLKEDAPLKEARAQIYMLMASMGGMGTRTNSTDGPLCYYSTDLNGEIKRVTTKDFFSLITPDEKTKVEAEMRKTGLVKYAIYAIQFYNKLFPAAK